MLEGAVARVLNQLLGKYVVDLDTENLNVGIFSGQVQLTDLKLKPEALYQLGLPVDVKIGTIGKIWLQIPWTSLWNQPIVVNVEDIHIVFGPIVTDEPFDQEKNKRLFRAAKKKVLESLEEEFQTLGGPASFAEHFFSYVINYLEFNVTNIHVRYEDSMSYKTPISAGLCIGSITAETTNSKWKPAKYERHSDTCYYIFKVEAVSLYWNPNATLKTWDLPSQYYQWRNTMSSSLQNYSINGEDFEFVLNPMAIKMKMIITKSPSGNVKSITSDVVIQDCNLHLSKLQYDSILAVIDSMWRMSISWQFLSIRPTVKIREDQKIWWRYASYALLEQRVKPYTWSRIRRTREHYKNYLDTYKQILLNPNDTELKMDLQKYEDSLSIINVVIARQQALLTVNGRGTTEKSFWSSLPSPERTILCEKIGFCYEEEDNRKATIEHNYTLRFGNFNVTLSHNSREVLVLTLTQMIVSVKPNFAEKTFRSCFKIEGIIIEGCSEEDHLISIISSEHLNDSPAYFLKVEFEKMPSISVTKYKLGVNMDSVECIYNKPSIDELETFFTNEEYSTKNIWNYLKQVPTYIGTFFRDKLLKNWELNLNIKIPYFVIPEVGSYLKAEYLLVIDFGRYRIKTELCQKTDIADNSTQMELDEQLFSKLIVNCRDIQVLFCDTSDNWKDARKEKDTDMHIIPKTSFTSMYAASVATIKTIPRYKFNLSFQMLKLNISERKISLLLKFFNIDQIRINISQQDEMSSKIFIKDVIQKRNTVSYLRKVQERVTVKNSYSKYKRHRLDNGKSKRMKNEKTVSRNYHCESTEAWAKTIDLPGLEDNISPSNRINILFGFFISEFSLVFSRSSDSTDKHYLMLRMGMVNMDVAFMTYGPAYQISLNSIILTDKLYTTPSGQYLDLVHSSFPNKYDVLTILYRKVSPGCPDFWTHFHGVETSLVANVGSLNVLFHQDAVNTMLQYSKYLIEKIRSQTSPYLKNTLMLLFKTLDSTLHRRSDTPVPPGSVKFSHSARLNNLDVILCDSDFDIVNIELSGLEMDFIFRTNERFVFRSFLSNINVEYLSDVTLYSKVLYTDEDKVFEIKYVRNAANLNCSSDISPNVDENFIDGSFKFQLGRINCTILYKLIVQLQRFLNNLDVLPALRDLFNKLKILAFSVTDNLKNNGKVNLAINVSGPVFLIPQKSSSPNVVVIDTGELKIENFFKEYSNELLENILIKLNGVTITRGIMTLTSILEMQETLVEPMSLNMDVKRNSNSKTFIDTWDIDSIIDAVQITLGQRDLVTIMAIYTENIGEGKLLDLLPNPIISPVNLVETEESVKTLEAFFCEAKQRKVLFKCTVEEIKFMLFFDSIELLSSPIRDLNHGLCKLEIQDVDVSFVVYNDRSLDGKLSVDIIKMEEIGPDVNAQEKYILLSPADDNKNNNSNITVNKPPIVDITFHKNKTNDKSMDVIVGRLSIILSIPFSEKLALFVIECLPKESIDTGIVNLGYEAETYTDKFHHSTSLTVSTRINKPELIFLIETTSNRKRYFVTKSEILLDYSRHANRMNLVMSLSGLHSLFYDLGDYSEEPYVVLKQCDVELCKSFSENSGEKITLAVSSIYVKLCSEVVHSMNDILNDIIEHFKIPESEPNKKSHTKNVENTDLWEPRKLDEYFSANENCEAKTKKVPLVHEIMLVPKFDIVVIFELEQVPVLLVKLNLELTVYDWSSSLSSTCEIKIQSNYFNETFQTWEPLIDPNVLDERDYKPWEVVIKIFQDKSHCMLDNNDRKNKSKATSKKKSRSVTTTEDEDSGEDMMYLEPLNTISNGNNRRIKTSLSTFLDDSDSENEDGTMEKLAAAISDLFTGDWNEEEDSDCAHSSEGDEDIEDHTKSKDSEVESKAFYVFLDAKETLNITITQNELKLIHELLTQYSNKIISVKSNRKAINLINDIGSHTKVEFYEKVLNRVPNTAEDDKLLLLKSYENEDSAPNSPKGSNYFGVDYFENINDDKDSHTEDGKEESTLVYDFETLASLQFNELSKSQLFDNISKNYLKIHVPSFLPVQTNCPKKNWEKFIRLHSVNPTQTYHLAAKHTISKAGRSITVSSPLKMKNETCFALSILYQPSILQQLNLEPIGDMTNPFESTMRITILEAYEEYNVPLYIAYHCKLFVQPAYAEGHYSSDSGIWWKDLATELDTTSDITCKPKPESNVDVFSLKVMLKRNLDKKNSHLHSIPNYVIHLLPPLNVHNFLPYTLEVLNVSLKQAIKVEPGEKNSVYSLDFSKDQKLVVRVKNNSTTWIGNLNMTRYLEEKIIAMPSETKETPGLTINVKSDREHGCNLYFYVPYWIVNKTGLPLQIKASPSNCLYETVNENVLLFTYKRRGKQTLSLRVNESNWSNEVNLECAGTTGLVVCKNIERKKKYLLFLNTELSSICPRLTKIISIWPSFLVTNNTNKPLSFMEHNEKTDLWIDLPPFQTIVFWPETNSMELYVKYRDSKVISHPFYITSQHRTVLRMDKGGALTVEITGGVDKYFQISFNEYQPGDAPILIKNYCADLFLKIQQQDLSPVTLLNPYHCLLYTWDDPTRPRQLVWNVYNNKGKGFSIDITKDGYGEENIRIHSVTPTTSQIESSSSDDSDSSNSLQQNFTKKIRKDKIVIHWIVYREGLQRTLLLTQDLKIYSMALKAFQEHCQLEGLLALSGLGLSIFTSENPKKEYIYAALSDTPAIWEVNVGRKWKTLTLELASWVEDKYRLHYKRCQLREYIHIDFEKMYMLKPFFAELRRNYHPSIYFHFRKSPNYQYFNVRLQSFQIDNKLTGNIILHPLPLQNMKEVSPAAEIILSRTTSKNLIVYKYTYIKLGNIFLNIDSDVITNIGKLLDGIKKMRDDAATSYIKDISSMHKSVTSSNHMILPTPKIVIEYLTMSGFEIQLNISNKIRVSLSENRCAYVTLLDYLFPLNISPYMPLDGVHHKISSFEYIDMNTSFTDVLKKSFGQVFSQFLQQYYSHVLGLQVLVNTFAIHPTIDIGQFESENIGNILLYTSRCLLGHINMSPAAIEACVLDIFINQNIENIQRIRRHGSYHKSGIVSKAITTSCKNFPTGVPNALAQLIVKNQNGMNYDGETFFRTTGKALLSLLTRHPDEKSDCVEVAKEALRRASILGESIKIHQRLTRYCNKHLGIKPFSTYESMGSYLLETISNSRFINDTYWAHAAIDTIGKSIVIVTLEHIIRINKSRLWDPWEIEWVTDLDDLVSMPKITSAELLLNIRQGETNIDQLQQVKIVGQKEILIWLHEKIEQALIVSMEDKSWTITETQ